MIDMQTVQGKIFAGNLLFSACCVAYLIWWSIAFRPGFTAPMALKGAMLLLTTALGVMGLSQIIAGCSRTDGGMRYITVMAAGAAVYLILLVLTNVLMQRQVTTELMLIVFWACMEFCACNALYAAGTFSMKAFIIIAVIVLIAAAAGMICYLKYYELEPVPAFYDGMIPLILFALVMIGISVYQKVVA